MKHSVITLQLHPGIIEVQGNEIAMDLPKGCMGFLLCFESKKAAREYCGKDVELILVNKVKTD